MIYYNTARELYHYGIPGMKWGVRRFQNKSGGLTSAGKKRYTKLESKKELTPEERKARTKKAVIVGATVVGTAAATYGAMKMSNAIRDNVYNNKVQRGMKCLQRAMDKGVSQNTISSMLDDIGSYKKESLVKSVMSTVDNNRVGKNIDYKNVYKILSGKR